MSLDGGYDVVEMHDRWEDFFVSVVNEALIVMLNPPEENDRGNSSSPRGD